MLRRMPGQLRYAGLAAHPGAVATVVAIGVGIAARNARAHWMGFDPRDLRQDLWFVSGGMLVAYTLTLSDEVGHGETLGVEVSGGFLSADFWFAGAVVDAAWDFGREAGRTLVGAEVGYGVFVGLDGGYVIEYGGGGLHHGAALRLFVPLINVFPYVRFGMLSGAPNYLEVGLLAKVPWLFDAE